MFWFNKTTTDTKRLSDLKHNKINMKKKNSKNENNKYLEMRIKLINRQMNEVIK